MEIQQRDNETLAAYVHQFKTEAKRCDFNSNTAAICIFKGLQNPHNIAAKIYEKGPQTLSEVIKLVEKFNKAQQVIATLTSSTVNMMLNDDQCFVSGMAGHIGHHYPNMQFINGKSLATSHKTPQIKSLHQEHTATTKGHAPCHVMATNIGQMTVP